MNIYCEVCDDWIDPKDLKRWTGDDRLHYLCPGCDSDLQPIEYFPVSTNDDETESE